MQIELLDPREPRGLFLQIYQQVTIEVQAMLARGEFANAKWVERLMLEYANLYRESFVLSEIRPDLLSPAWALAYENPDVTKGSASLQLFAAINAHVNRDLPYALVRAGTDFSSESMKNDFQTISRSFTITMPKLWNILTQYDLCVRPRPERQTALSLIQWAMKVTRERAWATGAKLQLTSTGPSALAERKKQEAALEVYALKQFRKIKYNPALYLDDMVCL